MPRSLRRLPLVPALAIVGGIAGSLILLAVLDATVLRPLPGVDSPRDLFVVSDHRISYPSLAGFVSAASRPGSGVTALAGYATRWFAVSADGGDRRIAGAAVAGDFFAVAGTRALLGRLLDPADDRPSAPPIAVLSESLWRDGFHGDPAIVGRPIRLNGTQFTVVGVAPREFRGFERERRTMLWVSAQAWIAAAPTSFGGLTLDRWGWSWLQPLARVSDRAAAATTLQIEADRQVETYPRFFDEHFDVRLTRATQVAAGFTSPETARLAAAGVSAVVAILVLFSIASAAPVLLARGEHRIGELATRLALGASRRRIALTQLAEPLVTTLSAMPIALALASRTLDYLAARPLPGGLLLGDLELTIDGRLAALGCVLAAIASLAAGLAPLRRLHRLEISRALTGRTLPDRHARRARAWLAGAQVAVSLTLIAAAALSVRSLSRSAAVDSGYEGARVAYSMLDAALLRTPPNEVRRIYRRALEAVASSPEVEAATLASKLPFDPGADSESVSISGYEPVAGETLEVEPLLVGAHALTTLGIELVDGRELDERDRPESVLAAVISEAAARRWFAGRSPVGERLSIRDVEFTIVGVAEDVRAHSLATLQAPAVYLAYEQIPEALSAQPMAVVVRGRSSAPEALAAARRAIAESVPGIPAEPSGTFAELYEAIVAPQRLGFALFGTFAAVGTLLATLGLYGLVAHAAAARRREIGLRLALGATPPRLIVAVAREALRPTVAGIAAGLALAFALAAAVRGAVYGLDSLDAGAPLAASAAMLLVSLAAAIVPAWRASSLDAAVALRDD